MLRQFMFMIRRFFFSGAQKSEEAFVGEAYLSEKEWDAIELNEAFFLAGLLVWSGLNTALDEKESIDESIFERGGGVVHVGSTKSESMESEAADINAITPAAKLYVCAFPVGPGFSCMSPHMQ